MACLCVFSPIPLILPHWQQWIQTYLFSENVFCQQPRELVLKSGSRVGIFRVERAEFIGVGQKFSMVGFYDGGNVWTWSATDATDALGNSVWAEEKPWIESWCGHCVHCRYSQRGNCV
ncbi:hypothetical protein EX30DRAFT_46047 [Ascodesmis nigricans]|uniref:Uncharacterized protein n=1 Tax=Ascodesmis nigricans TaxID=341454 RepID=A0A4S2MVR9_9PEZI|nr:hypothetical protein EX30DRAFT_46047 [Ascodesmis nigricans]